MDAGYRGFARDIRGLTLAVTAGVLLVHALPRIAPPLWLSVLAALALLPWRGRVLCLAFALGFLLSSLHAQRLLDAQWPDARHNEERWVQGVVTSLPERTRETGTRGDSGPQSPATTWRFTLKPDDPALPPRIRVAWYRADAQPRGAECWRLRLRLRGPHGSLNPGGFDYEGWLFRQHLGATATVRAAERCADAAGYPILRLRQAWVDRVDAVLGARTGAALIKALTVGATSDLRDDDWALFRLTGTTHLVAISGFNLAIAAGFAFFLVRWLWSSIPGACLRLPAQRLAAYGAALVAMLYAALAGFEPPVARALFMLLLVLIAAAANRLTTPSRVLAWAWLPIVLLDPCAVLAPGLWLSFGAVASIFYLVSARWHPESRWRAAIRVQLLLSLTLAPLSLYYFRGLSWPAPLINLLAVPVFALLTPLLSVAAIIAAASADAAVQLLPPLAYALEKVMQALQWIAALWPAAWWAAAPPLGALLLALIGSFCLFAPAGLPLRRLGALCVLPLFVPLQVPVRGGLELSVLDVGQGLAVLVRTQHHSLLFDAGPAFAEGFDAGASVVAPAALSSGLRRLDLLLLSHADNDHAGGVAAVRRLLKVDREIGAGLAEPCHDGQHWEWDGVRFTILHPSTAGDGEDNDDSCVLRIDGPFSVLLPGDIERRAERRLLKEHADALRADVLIAPHHGSKSSSTADFVAAVRPQLVVFASGWRNRFRHPRPEVVARYRQCGAEMVMSGESGALTIFRADDGLRLASWREGYRRFWNAAIERLPYWRREAAGMAEEACVEPMAGLDAY